MIKKTYYTLIELLIVCAIGLISLAGVCVVAGVIFGGCYVYNNGLEGTAERVMKGPEVEQVEQIDQGDLKNEWR